MKPIFIVSGEKKSGKTTFLINILTLLQTDGVVAGGFVALHETESDCYQIKNIETGEIVPLMQRVAGFEERPYHFKFFPKTIEIGNNCLRELMIYPPHIAIVDEIGGYELRGELWSSAFEQLIASSIPLIFSVKDRLLDRVLLKWDMEPTHIFNSVDFSKPDKACKLIKSFL